MARTIPSDLQLPVDPPYLLLFAGSSRAPDYETQHQLLVESEDERLPVVVEVFVDEESRVGREVIPEEVAARLRDVLGVEDDDFRVVLISAQGAVVGDFDAPVKQEAIREHLSSTS